MTAGIIYQQGLPLITDDRNTTAVNMFLQDQTTGLLSVPFLNDRGTFTLNGSTTIDSRFFDVDPGHGIQAGEIVELANSTTFMQAVVIAVVVNNIEIDSPINAVYTSSDSGIRSTKSMLVDGSVTPVVFSVKPTVSQRGHFTLMICSIESPNAMDFTKFGSINSLTNGCVARIKDGSGNFRNLFNWKNNGELIEHAGNGTFIDKTGGGQHGFVSSPAFGGQENNGVVVALNGLLGEELQVVIQDDLSLTLTKFHIVAQGHEV